MAGRYQFDTHLTEIGLKKRLCKNSLEGPVPVVPLLFIDYHLFVDQGLNRFKLQFPFVKVFPPQMLSSSSEGAIVQAVPIAFAPVESTSTFYSQPTKSQNKQSSSPFTNP